MITEQVHTGQFLVESTLDHHSRKEVMVAEDQNLLAGTVVAIDASDGDQVKTFNPATAAVNTVAGILYKGVDTTEATGTGESTKSVMVDINVGDHVVDGTLLIWHESMDDAAIATALESMSSVHVAKG